MSTKASTFKQLISQAGIVRAIGVNDGLSAILAEQSGFEALWASGLAISASHCVPDASILTMTEFLHAAKVMRNASRLPIVADCDTGFGGVSNVVRMVREYERAGISAVCIEDKEFPKRNSFLEGHTLADKHEFAAKIRCAKQARATEDFMVIARLESFISGMGLRDALERAQAYAEAGADAILVHSKQRDAGEILEFATEWRHLSINLPLIAVPTTYYNVKLHELETHGYKMVIYANQLLRASVTAMKQVLTELIRTGTTASMEDSIATVREIFSLIGTDELDALEGQYAEFVAESQQGVATVPSLIAHACGSEEFVHARD
jgi:phosphoenolpyruvate phosphomutase